MDDLTKAGAVSTFKQVIKELASSKVPVLLLGEKGAGKHLVARQIHDSGPASNGLFVECNCRNIDENGVKKLFSEQQPDTPSTVFFRDVLSLSASTQRTLLACMGTPETFRGPRIIASASSDLEIEARAGRFREDLRYRLGGVCIPIPPLRFRQDEIEALAEEYLEKYAAQFGGTKPVLTKELAKFLHSHPWMNNLPELEDAMRTVVAVGSVRVAITALQTSASGNGTKKGRSEPTLLLKQVGRAASQRAEQDLILKVLSRTNGNRKKAAQELRISYKALLYKLKGIGTTPGTAVSSGGEK